MKSPAATGFDRSLCSTQARLACGEQTPAGKRRIKLYNPLLGGERRLNMLLMSTTVWIIIGVAVVIVVAVIGRKIKDRYY